MTEKHQASLIGLLSAGCGTLLPTVATHEKPLSTDQLCTQFTKPTEAALFLLTDSWERVIRGSEDSVPTVGSSVHVDTQDHYHHLWKSACSDASSEIPAGTADVLRQIASGGATTLNSMSMPLVTLPMLRAKFALQLQGGDNAYSQSLTQSRLALSTSGLLYRHSIRLAASSSTTSALDDAALFTLLLLSQHRSAKQVAARKWIAYVDAIVSSESVGALVGAAFLASTSVCIPTADVASRRTLIASLSEALGDRVPQLHPQFVALFWTAVIEQLSLREATRASSSMLTVKTLMPVVVDYFYAMTASHLGGASRDGDGCLIDTPACIRSSPVFRASPSSSADAGHSAAVFDAYFGIFMPTVWQQIGFEWPWSAFVRLTRAIINDARKQGGSDAVVSDLSCRVEHFWNNIVSLLAPRSYKQRLGEIVASSLQRHVDAAYALDATRQFPLPIDDAMLTDLGRVATAIAAKAAQLTPGDNAALSDAIGVATLSLESLPHMVQLRRGEAALKAQGATRTASAALLDARMAGVLWMFLTLSKRLAVWSRNKDLFLSTFAPVLEKLRNNAEGAEIEGYDGEEDAQFPVRSPFVTVASLWLSAIMDPRRDDAGRKALLRRRVGFELLHFMSTCYLPLAQDGGRTTVGLVITARDMVALFAFAAGASAHDGSAVDATSLWATADADLRMIMRDVARRLASLQTRIESPSNVAAETFDGITKRIVLLESEQLTKWLRPIAHQADGLIGTTTPCWFAPAAVLQSSLLSH
jgi:hypothetical protein